MDDVERDRNKGVREKRAKWVNAAPLRRLRLASKFSNRTIDRLTQGGRMHVAMNKHRSSEMLLVEGAYSIQCVVI